MNERGIHGIVIRYADNALVDSSNQVILNNFDTLDKSKKIIIAKQDINNFDKSKKIIIKATTTYK